jgi:hyaluronan synthase
MILFNAGFALAAAHWALAWAERPHTGPPAPGTVAVCVPVHNEDPAALDRALAALACQTRIPDIIHVIDDGSTKADYTAVRRAWFTHPGIGPRLSWSWQPNAGKKHAQAVTVEAFPAADTSSWTPTCLEQRCVEELLKPFTDPDVWSVAAIEMVLNQDHNWLTLLTAARAFSFQLPPAPRRTPLLRGDHVNRGACAAYRGQLLRARCPPTRRDVLRAAHQTRRRRRADPVRADARQKPRSSPPRSCSPSTRRPCATT